MKQKMGKKGQLRRMLSRKLNIPFDIIPRRTEELLDLYNKNFTSSKSPIYKIDFYDTPAWLSLKREILSTYGCMCMKCHAQDVEMHVDHIKPRSKFPELELAISNLQVLCKHCNKTKGNKNEIDYRPSDISSWKLFQKTNKIYTVSV